MVAVTPISAWAAAADSAQQPMQFNVRGDDMDELVRVTDELKEELGKVQGLVDLDTTYRGGKPEVDVHVDRDRAAISGVPVASVATTIRALDRRRHGERAEGRRRRLRHRAPAAARSSRSGSSSCRTSRCAPRRAAGRPRERGRLDRGAGPSQIERQARQRQITVLAGLQGLPLGEAKKAVDAAAATSSRPISPPTTPAWPTSWASPSGTWRSR